MSAQWFRVISRGAGRQAQHVLCEPDRIEEHYPLDTYYPARPLDREPGEADRFLARQLQRDEDIYGRLAEEGRLNRMSRLEFLNEVRRVQGLNR